MKSNRITGFAVRAMAFLLIGIMIFLGLQCIFVPKRFPYIKTYDAGKLRYFYGEDRDSIDVLICGTSIPSRGILPMEMYEKYGISSYNLATSVQPVECAYYILNEALKTQSPKVFIMDVSNMYFDEWDAVMWRYLLDEMKLGKNKVEMSQEFINNQSDTNESVYTLTLPLIGYHTRWKELTKADFEVFKSNRRYYGKGGYLVSTVAGGITVEEMNRLAGEMLSNVSRTTYEYIGGVPYERAEENPLYNSDISENKISWLKKIKALCDENKVQLLLVKVPVVYWPQSLRSTWTSEKYNKMRALCDGLGIVYYDLLYETELNLDTGKDSHDGGCHLNFYGAEKVSMALGSYLKEHYELPDRHNARWDKELVSYQKVREVVRLELEQDFVTYINKLASDYKDKVIFIAASDDMAAGLNENDINALRTLGLQADYSNAIQNSYIAVIDNGEVAYEALSNRALSYGGGGNTCTKSGKPYELYSSGWWTNPKASIKLDGDELAMDRRGLNIVVYDDDRDLVLDSVSFDTFAAEYHVPGRNGGKIMVLEEAFEFYIMEVEDR